MAEAVPYFRAAAEGTPDADRWFNLASAATLARQVELGQYAFAMALRSKESGNEARGPSVAFMRQWYACALRDIQEYDLALDQIEALRPIYERLEITDQTFLFSRGVPFLSDTMNVAIDVFRALGPSFDATGWLDQFGAHLDPEGQECVKKALARLVALD